MKSRFSAWNNFSKIKVATAEAEEGEGLPEGADKEESGHSFPWPQPSLVVSLIRQGRVEACHNCDKDMSPTHLCEDDNKSTSKKTAPVYLPPPLKCDQCPMFFHWNDQSTLDLHIRLKHTNN